MQNEYTADATSPLPPVLDLAWMPSKVSSPAPSGAFDTSAPHGVMPETEAVRGGVSNLSSSSPMWPLSHGPFSSRAEQVPPLPQAQAESVQMATTPASQLLVGRPVTDTQSFLRTPLHPADFEAMLAGAPAVTPNPSLCFTDSGQANHQVNTVCTPLPCPTEHLQMHSTCSVCSTAYHSAHQLLLDAPKDICKCSTHVPYVPWRAQATMHMSCCLLLKRHLKMYSTYTVRFTACIRHQGHELLLNLLAFCVTVLNSHKVLQQGSDLLHCMTVVLSLTRTCYRLDPWYMPKLPYTLFMKIMTSVAMPAGTVLGEHLGRVWCSHWCFIPTTLHADTHPCQH